MERLTRSLTEQPDTCADSVWLASNELSAYCFPPVMFFFRIPAGGYRLAEERVGMVSAFCRCFADPENVKIAEALCWNIRKSVIEVAAETGLDAELVRERLEGDMEPFVVKRYDYGLHRWQISPWVMPLLFFLSHPHHGGLKKRQT